MECANTLTDEFDLDNWISAVGIDTNGSFVAPVQTDNSSSVEPTAISIEENVINCEINNSAERENANGSTSWNVASIMCGHGSCSFEDGAFYGSGSIDGSSSGFWKMDWESLRMLWKQRESVAHISWPFRPVTRRARAERRSGHGPIRPYIDLEEYPKSVALKLVKTYLKEWLMTHKGYSILIGGPGARVPQPDLKRHFVRCFGIVPYRSTLSRSCFLDTICITCFLLLGEEFARQVSVSLPTSVSQASSRSRPHREGAIEVGDLISIGHMGPIFQQIGGDLTLKKVQIPLHGHREPPSRRFNWVFDKLYHGHMYIMRIFEANIVDHVVLVDRRRWPSLIYDPADQYPIMMSSIALFKCAGPDAIKAKVIQLYCIIKHRRRGAEPSHHNLPRGLNV